jgi:fatty acid-binding protein DegV
VEVFEKVRTQHRAYERMMDLITGECKGADDAYLSILQADSMELAKTFHEDISIRLAIPDIPIYEAGAAITTHAGPGVLAVGFFH